jgi:anthranilate phosphoribosyltransferase
MSEVFADFLRAVGRGPTLSRPLSLEEAETAMGMILDGQAAPVQIGAFLLVLRYRTETPAEIAGFVQAVRLRLAIDDRQRVDLDWPSYADAHKQLPYFILAARLLAENGVRVLMHGIEGEGPAGTRQALAAIGIEPVSTGAGIDHALDETGFAYVPLEALCPSFAGLFGLKPLLGLRTAVHTAARELNPCRATHQIQGVFHPTYLELHQEAQRLLGQPCSITFKGGGGEGQRNPCKPCRALVRRQGEAFETRWDCKQGCDTYPWRDEPLDPGRIHDLWTGEFDAEAPRRAVTGTVAMCLWMMERAATPEEAETMAEAMWLGRNSILAAV